MAKLKMHAAASTLYG